MTEPVPPNHPIERTFERGEPTERLRVFVEALLRTGVQKLHTPAHLAGRDFYVTHRLFTNPRYPERTIPQDQFNEWGVHFTEAFALEVFEEIPPASQQFVPAGHVDTYLATLLNQGDQTKLVKAVRDMSIPSYQKRNPVTALPEPFNTATRQADKVWRFNALDVVDDTTQSQDILTSRQVAIYDQYGIAHGRSWRNLGLGSLLVGLELEILRQRGAVELGLPSSSYESKAVVARILGQNPQTARVPNSLDLTQLDRKHFARVAEQFIP